MTALDNAPSVASPQERGPAELAETRDSTRQLIQKMQNLPSQQHEAVRLKFQNQFSYREIAQVMGLTESHVGVILHQALKSLRAAIV